MTTTTEVENGGFGAFIGLASLPFSEPVYDKYGKVDTAATHDGQYGFGLYGAYDRLQIEATFNNITTPGSYSTIDEEVDTFSFGPRVFAERSFEIRPGFEFFAKGSLAVLYARGELDGRQNITTGLAGTQLASVRDVEDDIAFLANLRGGFNLSHTPYTLFTLFGEVEWRNDAYEVINPQFQAGNANTANLAPAHLEQTDVFAATFGAKLTFRLN